ncbi:MAG: hypothetical protein D6761_10135 [Candidatus Dadabacteria bacterium]|nr:MAG: hypothetical protein D6761_10135 [Candidatus Dadabacteria bacterium]
MPEQTEPTAGQLMAAAGLAAVATPLFWTWTIGFALVAARLHGLLARLPRATDLAMQLGLPGMAGHPTRTMSWPLGAAIGCAVLGLLTTALTVRALTISHSPNLPLPRLRLVTAIGFAAGLLLASDTISALLALIP